ncbi:sulfate ABC transporter permease subunit CysT [Tuwongella immobilis]|uniref:Sulfate transport system permease protein CysT n=1 Tax=Tuwongella immobilis TaxID=692036 RepID=A0A6C2YTN3_9BACT|nr:sulfate ABC transporter permease subunit CysT [Tuwongella immobilis]VIP04389.1 sulfate thiosulfate transporter subunit : Sulfate/thiosulfate transporter subunit OS=Mesorhizobium sp. L48C026A00 GN=X737_29710 PE=4 SV=1: BPD_transp_1 [Tuwongella immobilis]VTS06140.1 sulfate thiosulfate transporter subunit : Sulfate/thiosulfate transporter subunit OS=Mesorhizobium sp. L48C026A00 GN=X737_29710 PE=4 SV=1: BPD_transp_1 [Tuwongella immobilis]
MAQVNRRILPGFGISLGFTLMYLTVLVGIPLLACVVRVSSMAPSEFWNVVWNDPRVRSAYLLTFGASFVAALISVVIGLLIGWVLVRYEFPGKRFFDALVDLPFALPTAVAGLVFSNLYVPTGFLGQFLTPLGIELSYSRPGIVLVLVFIGFPFVVRTVQPVLESLDAETEEAAAALGANRWQTFCKVIFPSILPALVTGFALAFARALGEYGSVVFISGNLPFKTEIAPVLVVEQLEAFRYQAATAIALVLLIASFATLVIINWLERRSRRFEDGR